MSPVENPTPPPPVSDAPRRIGPQRFQKAPEPPGKRSLAQAVGAGLALAALVVGVPLGLIALGALPPIPTSWPTREDLTGTIGAEQVVGVLLWVVWLAWLQFTLCVLVEIRSAVQGVGLPSKVPLSGASQRLARVLVGSVLLAATAVGQASAAVPATVADASASAGKSVVSAAAATDGTVLGTVQERERTSDASSSATPSDHAVYRLGDMVLDPDDGKELLGHKVYVVQPPEGRYHDNLWDIAERTLGDGRRYQEIFELNKGRTQPDGHQLSLARLIYPNWLIVLPDDAAGVDVVTFEEPDTGAESGGTETGESAGAGSRGAGEAESGTAGETADTGESVEGGASDETRAGTTDSGLSGVARHSGGEGEDQSSLLGNPYRDLAAAGLLAAGLLAAVEAVRRRRRTPDPDADHAEAEVALRIGADPQRARWLDHALRSLASECRESGRPLPAVYAAFVDDDAVELLLAPPRTDAPGPWEADDDGRTWTLRRTAVAPSGAPAGAAAVPDDVLAPYPGLVSLGRDGERDVLVDLESAGGPISVVGDPGIAFEVVTALAVELATNAWSDHLRVSAADLPDELTVFDPGRLRVVENVADVLADLDARRVNALGPDVLTGRLRPGGGGAWMPEYLVMGAAPDADVATRLTELTDAASRSPLGVVCAGDMPGSRWTVSVDSTGTLEIPVLGLSVQANRLSWRSVEAVAGLIEPERSGGGGDHPQPPVLHEAWLPEARPDIPEPPAALEVAHLATAPVRVFVLGPVEVQTGGSIDDDRRALATEIVVHLALNREGVHPTVLAAAIWPRGVTAAVREATIARVRDWLGVDPDGSPYLRETTDGRLALSDDVVLDWDVVCALLRRSRAARNAREEMELLRQALRVARGPVLAERPPGRYAWIARARLERVASDVLVDAAHRLSVLCGDDGDPPTAAAAARAGLRVSLHEQVLWRDLLKAQYDADGPAGATAVAEEMSAAFTEIGVTDVQPETVALLDELLPTGEGGAGHHRRHPA